MCIRDRLCTLLRQYITSVTSAVSSNSAPSRHTKVTTYCCFLPDLTGFIGFCCARPSYQHHLPKAGLTMQACLLYTSKHTASKEEVIKIVSKSIFNVDIYKDNKLVKSNIDNLEPVSPSIDATISVNKDNPIITAVNIAQKNLGLEDGVYKFVFNSNIIADIDKASVSVTVTSVSYTHL